MKNFSYTLDKDCPAIVRFDHNDFGTNDLTSFASTEAAWEEERNKRWVKEQLSNGCTMEQCEQEFFNNVFEYAREKLTQEAADGEYWLADFGYVHRNNYRLEHFHQDKWQPATSDNFDYQEDALDEMQRLESEYGWRGLRVAVNTDGRLFHYDEFKYGKSDDDRSVQHRESNGEIELSNDTHMVTLSANDGTGPVRVCVLEHGAWLKTPYLSAEFHGKHDDQIFTTVIEWLKTDRTARVYALDIGVGAIKAPH